MFFQIGNSVAHSGDTFRIFVRNFTTKDFLEAHDQLDNIERVRLEILAETRPWHDLVGLDAELIHNNIADLLEYLVVQNLVVHVATPMQWYGVLMRPSILEGARAVNVTHMVDRTAARG